MRRNTPTSRWQEIVKLTAEINETETNKQRSIKQIIGSLRKSRRLKTFTKLTKRQREKIQILKKYWRQVGYYNRYEGNSENHKDRLKKKLVLHQTGKHGK